MKIRKYQLFLHFISRWQSILFLMTVLVFALTFVLAGIMTGRFEISQLDANISVQRAFGQVIFYLPIVKMMTFLLVSQAQNTSLLIRIGSRSLIAKYILRVLFYLDLVISVAVWMVWITAVLFLSRGQGGMTSVAANANLLMNIFTGLFLYTLMILALCVVFRSRAIGISLGLSLIICFYIVPFVNLTEVANLVTPKLTKDAIWPINIARQWLAIFIGAQIITILFNHVRLPVEG
ncbi:hypothetical protein AAG897_04540 [Lacticaseibacillus rhamnosus]|uniref:hypothetical protein n=1 Tax=Lacticaseibacillus rhamnosus TaxID=47715 RepID=UPI0031F54AA5